MPPDGITVLQPISTTVGVEDASKNSSVKQIRPVPQGTKIEKLSGPVSEEQRKQHYELFSKLGIPSIASLKQKEEKLQSAEDAKAEALRQRKNAFDAPQFKLAWDSICERVKELGRDSLFATLNKYEPQVDYTTYLVKLTIDNKVQEQDMNREKTWMLDQLRDTLQNDMIAFELVETTLEQSSQPYTNKEKFMKMAERNPALIYLAEKLKLEP